MLLDKSVRFLILDPSSSVVIMTTSLYFSLFPVLPFICKGNDLSIM